VAGKKLTVGRIRFRGGAREDPRQHAHAYRWCDRCTYVTESTFASTCPHCGGEGGDHVLRTAEYVEYAMGQGMMPELIGDDDEYRSRSEYDVAEYLTPLTQGADAARHQARTRGVGPWQVQFSRRREIQLYNRGLAEEVDGPHQGFMVCLACGAYRHPSQQRRDQRANPLEAANGHAAYCTVPGWPTVKLDVKDQRERHPDVEPHLHLRVGLTGDVVELRLPDPVAERFAEGESSWVTTLAYALKLGMQLEMQVDEREIGHFTIVRRPATGPELTLAYYDTLPGGTGYLGRLFDRLPEVAAVAHAHLAACSCQRACYRCLMQFWNQRDHPLLDKRLVLPTLAMLAEGAATAPAPSPSQRERFDSIVESDLFARLRELGMPRPRAGRENVLREPNGAGILQMDISWPDRRLMVLLDGREFHTTTADQVLTDEDRRNRAIAAGWRVLEFTGGEVVHHLDEVVDEIRAALEGRYLRVEFLTGPAATAPMAAEPGVRIACTGPLPAELAALGETEGFVGAGRVAAGGVEMPALAVRQDPAAVILAIDGVAWLADAGRWRRELRLMRELSLGGVRCFRLPLERLQDQPGLRHALGLMGMRP
jgi:hypothetical protein